MSVVPDIATYRLQFTPEFGFRDALRALPYLRDLGISHIYASPITRARRGSTHGYDVCDPREVNPELGTREELLELLRAVRGEGMGWVQDVVPNHMSASTENPLWLDLLTHGRRSRWARFFDIDWDHPDLDGRVQLTVLAEPYAACLRAGDLRIDPAAGGPRLAYGDLRLPMDPRTLGPLFADHAACRELAAAVAVAAVEADADRREEKLIAAWSLLADPTVRASYAEACAGMAGDRLDRLLLEQPWRLAWWRSGREMTGYRRFFAVNELVAVRSETDEAFATMHALAFALADEDLIDALRIDHIDGLRDPESYLARLRARLPGTGILVEKILGGDEELPRTWRVDGTSGYEFLANVGPACSDGDSWERIDELHRRFVPDAGDRARLATRLREDIDGLGLAGDLDRVVRAIRAARDVAAVVRDIAPRALRAALAAIVARFAVYRTYGDAQGRPVLTAACGRAAADRPELATVIRALAGFLDGGLAADAPEAVREAVLRFQQLTGPAMAKGCEDTFFYADARWIACNEVGGDPLRPAMAPERFIAFAAHRGASWPRTMNATATHDTKRGEDTRARLAALTWRIGSWEAFATRWMAHGDGKVHAADRYFLLQTLVASWPADPAREDYRQRLVDCCRKSLREAGRRTGWSDPDTAYEERVFDWLSGLLDDVPPGFHAACAELCRDLAPWTDAVALCQTVLKCSLPGVPDIYQGSEWADWSLVDPDNRRPVDFPRLEAGLLPLAAPLPPPGDPRRKQAVVRRCLAARWSAPRLWSHGETSVLAVEGDRRGVFAFRRSLAGGPEALVIATASPGSQARVEIPSGRWVDSLTGSATSGGLRPVAELLAAGLPCAVLQAEQRSPARPQESA